MRRCLGELSRLRHGLQRSDALDLRDATHEHGIAIRGKYSEIGIDREGVGPRVSRHGIAYLKVWSLVKLGFQDRGCAERRRSLEDSRREQQQALAADPARAARP